MSRLGISTNDAPGMYFPTITPPATAERRLSFRGWRVPPAGYLSRKICSRNFSCGNFSRNNNFQTHRVDVFEDCADPDAGNCFKPGAPATGPLYGLPSDKPSCRCVGHPESVSEIEFCTLYVVAERWILGCILRFMHAKDHFSDTLLGWILFQEGKPAEAEPYLRAAWFTHADVAVGDHISQI
jgi:hypothetical protein